METCFVNLVQPGDKVVVCLNGVFGGRMKENVERCGGTAILVEDAWGRAVDPGKVEAALKAQPGGADPGLRACRDLDRRHFGCENARGDRPPLMTA